MLTQAPIPQRELVEALSDTLAALLVSEFRARRNQQDQPVPVVMIETLKGINHTDPQETNA